jgi:WD40 repeat protein
MIWNDYHSTPGKTNSLPLPPSLPPSLFPSLLPSPPSLPQDNTFFASCSDDGTVKVWELRGLDSNVSPRSALTYRQQVRVPPQVAGREWASSVGRV